MPPARKQTASKAAKPADEQPAQPAEQPQPDGAGEQQEQEPDAGAEQNDSQPEPEQTSPAGRRSGAAPVTSPEEVAPKGGGAQRDDKAAGAVHPVSESAAAPHAAAAGGAGRRFVTEGGGAVTNFDSVVDSTAETVVTLGEDVYEVHAAPGAPNRVIKKLLFHKGQRVPKSVLNKAMDEQKANKAEVDRLERVERERREKLDAEAETKEHGLVLGGETKEGARGAVPRR